MLARLFSSVIFLLLLAGCLLPGPTREPQPDMVNPAAAYCLEQGGQIETRLDASGGQYGVCIFPDGSECDEWAFFRGECQPGSAATAPSPVPEGVYVNAAYGFSFDPPDPWTFDDQDHLVRFRHLNYILSVQYGWVDEDLPRFHTPDPDLARVEAPPASLLGQSLPKWLMMDQEKVKQVEYAPEVAVDRLLLTAWLGYDETMPIDPGEFEMPDEIITQADEIIASFTLISGETPAVTFGD